MNSTKEKAENYCNHHLLGYLQEKLMAKEKTRKSRENIFELQRQITMQSQKLARQKKENQQKQKELALWKLWQKAKHSAQDSEVQTATTEHKENKLTVISSRKRSTPLSGITDNSDKNPDCKLILNRRKFSF